MAWAELIKEQMPNSDFASEFEKDVKRLEIITDRFSKIGSVPVLKPESLNETVHSAIDYLRRRSSSKISFVLSFEKTDIILPLSRSLFEWVLENICKNAMDAIADEGTISINIQQNKRNVYIDISDTGKGISKSKQKTIFKPGYTTKTRGWGLGLSLVKRIVENYHKGKIFVLSSEPGKGTTFRIILKNKMHS
jgi:signal transduction histidine kinase